MNLAGKINGLVLVLTVLASMVFTGIAGVQAFSAARDRQVESSIARVRSQPVLSMLIYQQDQRRMGEFLKQQLNSATPYAALFDSSGGLILEQQRSPELAYNLASLKHIRADTNATEVGRHQRQVQGASKDLFGLAASDTVPVPGWLGGHITDVTIPVLSIINPLEAAVSWEDFSLAMRNADEARSLYVVGYVNVGISHAYLWRQVIPTIRDTLLACTVLVLACLAASLMYGRRITGPLSRLAEQAEKVASGKFDSEVKFSANGEAKHLANMLNFIVGEVKSHKTSMNVSHQLLNMKVEERDAQLSARDQELSVAVDEVTRSREELHRMAYFDSLTGLPNRRLFTEQLNLLMRLAIRNDDSLALLFLDLDNFKRINDSLGHSVGDLLLREVGIRLASCMRDSDVLSHYVDSESHIEVSRLGGDEFTVILNQIDSPEAAGMVAQRLLDTMAVPVIIDGNELVVSPSIGIAIGPRDATTLEDLLKAADTAMYHAKTSGKNNFLFYSKDMSATDVERLHLESDLRRAIERDELVLHYQPQVDLETGSVTGVEALIRWQHPERGLVPPLSFIPLAEELGLIISIGQWVLEEACRQLQHLQNTGRPLPKMAVNVSALAFSSTFVDHVKGVLDSTGVDPGLLELELTEGVMMDSSSATIESLRQLKDLGVGLAMDDFGTGFSSLSYLSHFPLDTLKIDRSFVVDFDKNERNRGLVAAIISMAGSLNLALVAEGVETAQQLEFLQHNGVTVIQGYLFSKPVPAQELPALLEPGRFSFPQALPDATGNRNLGQPGAA